MAKKLSAMQSAPMTKLALVRTARMAAGEAAVGADVVEVAELLHAGGDEDFTGDGESGDEGDGGPGAEHAAVLRSSVTGRLRSPSGRGPGCSVREGPPATKPTAQMMSAMPAQRERERCSCSMNWPSSAMMT